jgi:phosphate-selective porin
VFHPLQTGLVVAATIAATAPAHAGNAKRGPGVSLQWPDEGAELRLTGLAQWDLHSYPNWQADDRLRSAPSDLPRRLRLGLEGRVKRVAFEVDGDTQADPGDRDDHLRDLFAELRVDKGLRLRAGHFKLPVSAERLTPAARLDFVERTRLGDDLAPGRDWGLMAHGSPGRFDYAAGVFKGDGRTRPSRAGTTVAARLVVAAARSIDVGASFAQGRVQAEPVLPDTSPDPRGIAGQAASGFRFFPRQFVNGRRRRLGVEAAYTTGPLAFKAEALRLGDERLGQGPICTPAADAPACDDLPDLIAHGWSVSATWVLTGEKKTRSIKPGRPFPGGIGALEAGLRLERIRLDDAGPDLGLPGASNRARNVPRSGEDALTAGLSWWPRAWARLMANLVVERFEDPLVAPEPGRPGKYVTLLVRLQLQVP